MKRLTMISLCMSMYVSPVMAESRTELCARWYGFLPQGPNGLPEGAEAFNSGTIKQGESFALILTTPGDYKYTCLPHERMGMQGRIQVVPSSTTSGASFGAACTLTLAGARGNFSESVNLTGAVGNEGGTVISQNVTLGAVTANFHFYYIPSSGFVSMNFFHEPTDYVINTDTRIEPGLPVSIFGRTKQIGESVDSVFAKCSFGS
jgi:Copper binding proteins, plastocyanin/azurin family